jgi:hypothetical protein
MTSTRILRGLAFAAAVCVSTLSSAIPLQYDFSLAWYEGALTGTRSEGRFAFDSSVVQPGDQYGLDFLEDFDLTLRGIRFDETSIMSLMLGFDADGQLAKFAMGTDCMVDTSELRYSSCTVSTDLDSFAMGYNPEIGSVAGVGDGLVPCNRNCVSLADIAFAPAAPVPEPSSWMMLCVGLGLLALAGRGAMTTPYWPADVRPPGGPSSTRSAPPALRAARRSRARFSHS